MRKPDCFPALRLHPNIWRRPHCRDRVERDHWCSLRPAARPCRQVLCGRNGLHCLHASLASLCSLLYSGHPEIHRGPATFGFILVGFFLGTTASSLATRVVGAWLGLFNVGFKVRTHLQITLRPQNKGPKLASPEKVSSCRSCLALMSWSRQQSSPESFFTAVRDQEAVREQHLAGNSSYSRCCRHAGLGRLLSSGKIMSSLI